MAETGNKMEGGGRWEGMDVTGSEEVETPNEAATLDLAASGLARLPETAWIDEAALAREFGVSGRSIRRMVKRGELPPPILLGGRNHWNIDRVLRWLDDRAQQAEADARAVQEREANERDAIEAKLVKMGMV